MQAAMRLHNQHTCSRQPHQCNSLLMGNLTEVGKVLLRRVAHDNCGNNVLPGNCVPWLGSVTIFHSTSMIMMSIVLVRAMLPVNKRKVWPGNACCDKLCGVT